MQEQATSLRQQMAFFQLQEGSASKPAAKTTGVAKKATPARANAVLATARPVAEAAGEWAEF
jgi:hypothetical protein